ncbi:MAG: hypothetical protein IKY61_01430 [Thermoguttaceae bacterium]|nr:hypothetical protein [Thermoguttaceae bacterium]
MLHQCDKCGAATRWYDEKCPRCGATKTVEIPAAPIVLPSFAPSPTRRANQNVATQEKKTSQPNVATQEKKTPERPQRFLVFEQTVDAWRSAFAPETSSVTLPRERVARYALGIVAELFVSPPCAILAAYFFTRALLADRRAQYHAAMQETERTRRALVVGLGVFAAFLCAFIFYVQSQEVTVPPPSGTNSNLFKK